MQQIDLKSELNFKNFFKKQNSLFKSAIIVLGN